MWRWGVMRSMSSRNAIPARKPTAAGMTDILPMSAHMSMPGMSRDHTEAATMTPEAKPKSDFCTFGGILSFMKNTKAEPATVPINGMRRMDSISLRLFGYAVVRLYGYGE